MTSAIYDTGVGITYTYDEVGNRTQKISSTTATANNPPNVPVAVFPLNDAVDIPVIDLQLQWNGGDPDPGTTVHYSVYFGDTTEPSLLQADTTATSQNVPQLTPGKTYYWKVVAKDQYYLKSESQLFSFTTDPIPPHPAINPTPAANSSVSYANVSLSWDVDGVAGQTYTYDIQFGTTTNLAVIAQGLTSKTYSLGTLAPSQDYYWRVVVTDSEGLATTGPLWKFTTNPAASQTFTSPSFKTNVTLSKSGSPYIVSGTMNINAGATLTIDPGAVVKMQPYASITVNGTLIANGTSEDKIVFTSNKNDARGGDTNGDGDATTPAPGDWYGITFSSTATPASSLNNCMVEYAGYYNAAAVTISGSSPSILNTTITNNKYYGIYVQSGNPIIEDTRITSNGYYGIYVQSGSPSISDNTVSGSIYFPSTGLSVLRGNSLTIDASNPLHIPADNVGSLFANNNIIAGSGHIEVIGGTISHDATWPASVPLYILGSITVQGTDGDDSITTLTLKPGVSLKFANSAVLLVGATSGNPGALIAKGTAEKEILFGSSDASPAAGKWYGIVFYNTAASSSIMDHCIVEYAGTSNYPAVQVQSSSPVISNSKIRNNKYNGIYLYNGSPQITCNTVTDSGYYGLYLQAGTPVIDDNTIYDGMYLTSAGTTSLSGNTLSLHADKPLYIPAADIGALLTKNSISNINSDSYVKVAGGAVTKDAIWKNILPLQIQGSITVKGTDGDNSLTTLTIEPGTTLKFNNATQLIIGASSGSPGELHAVGTEELPITFTASNATPSAGNWYGVSFLATSSNQSIMEHCIVKYAGYGSSGAISINGSSPTIRSCKISDNKSYGVYIYNGSPVISNNSIFNNGSYSIYTYLGSPVISSNIIHNNTTWGIYIGAGTPSLMGNTVQGSIYFPNNNISQISGNTIALDTSQVLKVPVDHLGRLLSENTITNITEDSYIEVMGGTVTKDATWKNIVPLHILGTITVKGTDGDDHITHYPHNCSRHQSYVWSIPTAHHRCFFRRSWRTPRPWN